MGKRGRKQLSASSQSGSSGTDTSLVVSTPSQKRKNIQKKFKDSSDPQEHSHCVVDEVCAIRGNKCDKDKMSDDNSVFSPKSRTPATYGYDEVMRKLCAIGTAVEKLSESVDELKSSLFTLQTQNDQLRAEVREMRGKEEELKTQLAEVKFTAELADRRSEELSICIRRNNLRIFGVGEEGSQQGREETVMECERKVLSLFRDKLKLTVDPKDVEAVHRVGARKKGASDNAKKPRGIIVRFVSRRVRDEVLYARRKLRGTKILMVEDLTPRAYSLLCVTRDNKQVCERAWSKNGKVFMKTLGGNIVQVDSVSDLTKRSQEYEESKRRSPRPFDSTSASQPNGSE